MARDGIDAETETTEQIRQREDFGDYDPMLGCPECFRLSVSQKGCHVKVIDDTPLGTMDYAVVKSKSIYWSL